MKIESYRFGEMVIDGRSYTKDLKIIRAAVVEKWWREQGHEVKLSDISDVIAAQPKVLIVGTGASGLLRLATGLSEELAKAGIRLEILKTADALRRFNELSAREGPDSVAAAFHLTC